MHLDEVDWLSVGMLPSTDVGAMNATTRTIYVEVFG